MARAEAPVIPGGSLGFFHFNFLRHRYIYAKVVYKFYHGGKVMGVAGFGCVVLEEKKEDVVRFAPSAF